MRRKENQKISASAKPSECLPRIESFKDYYTGRMYALFIFDRDTHLSLSHPGDFGDGQKALIHLEDGKNYKDLLFPSLKVLKEKGTSEMISKLMVFAERGTEAIEVSLSYHEEADPKDILVGKKA